MALKTYKCAVEIVAQKQHWIRLGPSSNFGEVHTVIDRNLFFSRTKFSEYLISLLTEIYRNINLFGGERVILISPSYSCVPSVIHSEYLNV